MTVAGSLIKIGMKGGFIGAMIIYGPFVVAGVVGSQVLVFGTIALISGIADHVVDLVV